MEMIRDAALEDCGDIASLLGELGYPATEQFAREQAARFGSRLDAKVLVAEIEAEVVGVLCVQIIPLFHLSEGLARITTLVVSSRFKRHGIGRRLVEHAEAFAWEYGCARIEITSGDHRSAAHAFYEAIGYEEVNRRFLKAKPN
jgi:GNAT superfamily N-acetyltransferase